MSVPEPTTGARAARTPAARKRPTIRDVAREAGVSYATVSRVLNGHEWVSPESARAVREAVARTGYTANPHARSLVTGRSGSIAFLLTEPQHLLFEDPVFSVLLRGVAQALSERSLTPVLLIAGTADERSRVLAYLQGGHVDGVLLVSSHAGDPLPGQLAATEVPVVACGRVLGMEGRISSVSADDRGGARAAVEHLLATGRRRVATITGPLDTPGGIDRLEGYRDVLRAAGEEPAPSLVRHGDWSRESGAAAMRSLLDVEPELDAVFVASDLMASGALAALRAAGRTVPGDVAVVGFDDTGLAATLEPPLTSVRQPLDRIGREVVRLVVDGIEGGEPLAATVPTSLVLRESAP
ncbi:LacI family DNA-binding transcriptional regulator [Kineococcus auxinigenes]|uniref:LacI family DNA-binding transcriptional regulator n=1 Tax=Kineococcus sp. SYSU DK033 TaxID=3383154 RepID=UPI003D7E3DF6